MENSVSYFGIIEINSVETIWPEGIEQNTTLELLITSTKIVHYEDCQQMIIWLPTYGTLYDEIAITNTSTQEITWTCKVTDFLNGSIMILIDSLFISPGEYSMKISKSDGLQHILTFRKQEEKIQVPSQPKVTPPLSPEEPSEEKYMMDELGNKYTMEDDRYWEIFKQETINRVFRNVEYVSQGRSGKVIYKEGKKEITFYMEMGGGDCMFYLDIPSVANWEKSTGFTLLRRDDIVEYIAQRTKSDQASSSTYKIEDTGIVFYRK